MTCIIIEDQPPAQRILKKYIEDIGTLELQGTYSNAIQAMEHLQRERVDLIFLDIHLPKISGIDFLKSIPHPPAVILTTAFPDYALEGYELNVVDYLLKPFSFLRFVKAVHKVPVRAAADPGQVNAPAPPASTDIFVKSGYAYIRISVQDILYIKSDADYTEIHTPEKKHLSSEPLRYWLEELAGDPFIQVHKSYIIGISKITKVVGNQVYLQGDLRIPIGRAYKEAFAERLLK